MSEVVDGLFYAQQLESSIVEEQRRFPHLKPGLAVVQVGDDPASSTYVRRKSHRAAALGFYSEIHRIDPEQGSAVLSETIDALNQRLDIHGILLQLPIPSDWDTDALVNRVAPAKDVDGFHAYNVGRLAQGRPLLKPCTPAGIMYLLRALNFNLVGLSATVLGQSRTVGLPMALELLQSGCTVTVCHAKTPLDRLLQATRQADLLITATGQPEMVRGDWIKPGAMVIDVGTRRQGHRLVGDCHFESVAQKAGWITPVPGGVGPLTVAMLMKNTWEAAKLQEIPSEV